MNTSSKLILTLAAFTAGVMTVRIINMMQSGAGGSSDWNQVAAVRDIIKERYVEEVSDEKLRDGAIRGMVESLGDPYSVYVSSEEAADFNKDLTGEYVGIGAEVNTRSGWLTIANPMEESPALRAGLLPEDRVLRINGTSTKDLAVDACVKLLLGEPGTSVLLDVQRGSKEFSVQIERARIKARAVKGLVRVGSDGTWNYMIDPAARIGYVRLTQFTPSVVEEVSAALRAMGANAEGVAANGAGSLQGSLQSPLRGLVIDLRFNGGGLLDAAEQIADMFLEQGKIVSTRGRAHKERVSTAQARGTLPDFPIAVLVNGESASASEVLAGALQDNNRAVIVGTRSYGKGSVQSLMELDPDASAAGKPTAELKLTEQGYYLPSDRSIQRKDDAKVWGVDPNPGFYVAMPQASLVEMLRVRRKLELISAPPPAIEATDAFEKQLNSALASPNWDDANWILALLRDPQLSAAVKAVQLRIASGANGANGIWQPTGETEQSPVVASADELVRLRQVQERLLRELDRTQKRLDTMEGVEGAKPLADARNTRDLWNDSASLVDGSVQVRDKEGKVIATLKITGDDLERWLMDADVEKVTSEKEKAAGGGS